MLVSLAVGEQDLEPTRTQHRTCSHHREGVLHHRPIGIDRGLAPMQSEDDDNEKSCLLSESIWKRLAKNILSSALHSEFGRQTH